MKDKNIVIFNAPPNAGKDVAANYMLDYFNSGEHLAFKDALYKDVAYYFDIPLQEVIEECSDRDKKEYASELFPKHKIYSGWKFIISYIYYLVTIFIHIDWVQDKAYFSPRQALIHISENVIKVLYGNDYYGKCLLDAVNNSEHSWFFVSDGGFKEEIVPLLDAGVNVIIVHIIRDKCDFNNDSRTWLPRDMFENDEKKYDNLFITAIDNNGSLDDLYENIANLSYDIAMNSIQYYYGEGDIYEVLRQ